MADLFGIPAEAVEAAARAAFLRQTDFDHLSDPGKDAERFQARRMLSAALPVLNTARDAELVRLRAEVAVLRQRDAEYTASLGGGQ